MVTSVIPNWLPMKAGEVVFASDQPNPLLWLQLVFWFKARNHTVMCSNRITMYNPPLSFSSIKTECIIQSPWETTQWESPRSRRIFTRSRLPKHEGLFRNIAHGHSAWKIPPMSATWRLAAFFSPPKSNMEAQTWRSGRFSFSNGGDFFRFHRSFQGSIYSI